MTYASTTVLFDTGQAKESFKCGAGGCDNRDYNIDDVNHAHNVAGANDGQEVQRRVTATASDICKTPSPVDVSVIQPKDGSVLTQSRVRGLRASRTDSRSMRWSQVLSNQLRYIEGGWHASKWRQQC